MCLLHKSFMLWNHSGCESFVSYLWNADSQTKYQSFSPNWYGIDHDDDWRCISLDTGDCLQPIISIIFGFQSLSQCVALESFQPVQQD